MNIDLYLFGAINRYAGKSRIIDSLAVFFADYVVYIFIAVLLVVAIVMGQWRIFFIPLLAGGISRFIIVGIIYAFYQRKRPLEVLTITSLIKKPNHPSFPSGHASFFFGVAFAIAFFSFPWAIAASLLILLVCLARIFCGVHWPLDILGGAGAALIACIIIQQLT